MIFDAQYDLVAIGRPYTDIIVRVTDEMILNFGLPKGKVWEIQPAQMDELRSQVIDYTIYPGGSPPNTCAGIQAFGGKAVFIGKVCDDKSGRAFRKGFPPGDVLFPTKSYSGPARNLSGTCLVLITPDDVGTVVNCPGVGDILTEDDIPEALINNTKMLYLQAHFLFADTAKDAVLKAISFVKAARRPVAVSLHDHRMNAAQADYFIEYYLPSIDILIGNRGEFNLLFRPYDPDRDVNGSTLTVMTAGAMGAYITGRRENLHIAPHVLKARDNTVGAGDAFAAGFFFGYVRGLDLHSCGDLGAEAASTILEIPGARPIGSWKAMAEKYLEKAPATFRVQAESTK